MKVWVVENSGDSYLLSRINVLGGADRVVVRTAETELGENRDNVRFFM